MVLRDLAVLMPGQAAQGPISSTLKARIAAAERDESRRVCKNEEQLVVSANRGGGAAEAADIPRRIMEN